MQEKDRILARFVGSIHPNKRLTGTDHLLSGIGLANLFSGRVLEHCICDPSARLVLAPQLAD